MLTIKMTPIGEWFGITLCADNFKEETPELLAWLIENHITTYAHVPHYYIDPDTRMEPAMLDELTRLFIISKQESILFCLRWADHIEIEEINMKARAVSRKYFPTLADVKKSNKKDRSKIIY